MADVDALDAAFCKTLAATLHLTELQVDTAINDLLQEAMPPEIDLFLVKSMKLLRYSVFPAAKVALALQEFMLNDRLPQSPSMVAEILKLWYECFCMHFDPHVAGRVQRRGLPAIFSLKCCVVFAATTPGAKLTSFSPLSICASIF